MNEIHKENIENIVVKLELDINSILLANLILYCFAMNFFFLVEFESRWRSDE